MNITNRTVFITGGSAGIGFQIAKLFLNDDTKIAIEFFQIKKTHNMVCK